MNRIAAAALLAAALAAAPSPADAKESPFRLVLKAGKAKVALGERIPLEVTLQYAGPKAVACAKLELGAPSGVVLYFKDPAKRLFQVTRLKGRYNGNDFRETPPSREELRPGKTLVGTVEPVAIQAGTWEISAAYGGAPRDVQAVPVDAKPVTVVVAPGAGGETKVGARVRTDKGDMTFELLPEKAFNTVHNFLSLAKDGFYRDRVFHRVMKDFMVQTGDPNGNGTGGPGYCVPAEFNDLSHEKGVLSMAREFHANTAGSQFFVMTAKNAGLDGKYTGFGRLVEGQDVLDALAAVPVKMTVPRDPKEKPELSDPVAKPKLLGVDPVLLK
jgi:peptidyl-prolyl cis-trans isomerase B (cyclophilin B)